MLWIPPGPEIHLPGIFLNARRMAKSPQAALRLASKARVHRCVQGGAAVSIPYWRKLSGEKNRAGNMCGDGDGKSCPEKGDDEYFRELFELRQPGNDTVVVRRPTATVL